MRCYFTAKKKSDNKPSEKPKASEKPKKEAKGGTKKAAKKAPAGGGKAKKKKPWGSGSESEEEHYSMSDSDSDGFVPRPAADKPKRKAATAKYNFGDDSDESNDDTSPKVFRFSLQRIGSW